MTTIKYKKQILEAFSRLPYLLPGKWHNSLGIGPAYVGSRLMYSNPKMLKLCGKAMGEIALKLPIDAICGVPSAGIPLASVVSVETKIPFLYGRKKRGSKGQRRYVEGDFKKGWRIALIEDASGSGSTKKGIIPGIKKEGLRFSHIIQLFDCEVKKDPLYSRNNIKFHSLVKHSELIQYMVRTKRISKELGKVFMEVFNADKMRWWEKEATAEDWKNYKNLCEESNYPFFINK